MALADGVYKIETAMDVNVMDIDGISQANKANLMICAPNSGNNQKFKLTTNGSYRQFFACHSNKVLEVFGRLTAVNGDNISQYTSNNGVNQKWTLEDSTDSSGAACVIIRSAMNAGFVMDAAYKTNKSGDNVMLGAYNGGDNQKWVFHKDTFYDTKLPVPASIGFATAINGTKYVNPSINGTGTLFPAWVGNAGGFQLRYRTRGRKTGTDSWSGWSSWKSPDGATTDEGWGDAWNQAGTSSGSGTNRYSPTGISFTLDQTTYDRLQYQVEVRRFQVDGNATFGNTHGGSCTGSGYINFMPNMTFSDISFAPDGLRVPYASDYRRGNNNLTLTLKVGDKKLVSNFQTAQRSYDDTVLIPFEKLSFIPNDGVSCAITCVIKTYDGTSYTRTATKPIAYSTGHGTSISDTWTATEGYCETVSIGTSGTNSAYLLIEQGGEGRFVACDQLSAGKFNVVPPLGVEYSVYLIKQISSDSWATKMVTRSAMDNVDLFLWNFDNEYMALEYDQSYSRTNDRDYMSHQPSGSNTEVTHFGAGSKVEFNITGNLVDDSSYEDFERLEICDYAVFRPPWGKWYRVAVVGTSETREGPRVTGVTVSMKEQS